VRHQRAVGEEDRQVGAPPFKKTQLHQQRRGTLHHLATEALGGVTVEAGGTQPVAPVGQAAVQPALLQQG
ncbi:hypothetical protein TI06_24075, partial [Vibrio vulnificus]